MALHILRKISQAAIDELHVPIPQPGEPAKDFLYLDKTKPWFSDRYVSAEHPRDQYTNATIVENTEGFAVWADGEGVVATFDSYAAADRAKNSAKMTLSVHVDLPDAEESVEEATQQPEPVDAAELGAAAS